MTRVIVAVLLLSLAFVVSAEFQDKTEAEFLKTSEQCFKQLKVPQSFKPKFDAFDYPDEPIVHRYFHCIWIDLQLWDDTNGFNVEHIANLYRDRANSEILIPIIGECNRNKQNDPPLKWVYRAFKCILDSRVGTWFKEDITKERQKL